MVLYQQEYNILSYNSVNKLRMKNGKGLRPLSGRGTVIVVQLYEFWVQPSEVMLTC